MNAEHPSPGKRPARLDGSLAPAEAWRQAVAAECATALGWLAAPPGVPPARAIHQARRACKRVRALLRLAEPALGESAADARRWVAVSARQLAPSRDATVRAATLSAVIAEYRQSLATEACETLEAAFAIEAPVAIPEQARAEAAATLAAVAEVLADAGMQSLSRPSLLRGARLAYRRARKAWRLAREGEDPAAWHALRSASQVHLNQLSALRRCTGRRFRARERELKQLVALLGEAHDLWMLRSALVEAQEGSLGALLLPLLAAREHACYQAATVLAKALFAVRPRQLHAGLEQAWVDTEVAGERAAREGEGEHEVDADGDNGPVDE